ncbi:hypothetical protein CHS0354_024722 [Potamilus streckersoni]|uniref:Trafficking protein particle complex subunit 8 n=1 Tax=Potamilus streckersoni TaxID=2493646 RepID=A0AAE0VK30_9BIVA|nr:hypothetical protein CHS0354_024722 [Potamilus streckersoni]
MACAAIFMLGNLSQRQYPHHYMESAITTYTQSCRNWQYATRASLISTEALKNRGMYTEAAMQFIKMMSEESDLQSALFLEQAAHCFINMKAPMVRKYAFHMILAGHRFSKAGQRKHALRTYSQAMQVYKGKNWSLAEDHINFTLGRQSHSLKQLENATAAFKHLLTENSKQTASQQNAFLREYLFVYRQLLQQEAGEMGVLTGALPELPLPTLDSNATRVLMGSRPQPPQGDRIPATGVWFDQADVNNSKWHKLEELLVASANGGTLPLIFKPSLQCYSSKTENRFNPVGFVREPIIVEIYLVNLLKVPLALANVTLLWTFLPTVSGHDKPQLITNEHASTVKNLLADEIIHSQVIEEIILQGNERLPIQLTLVPQQMGDLRIVGLAYNLGSSTPGFSMTSQGGLMGNGGVGGSGPKASYVSTVYVRGKQKLEVQGPRLNNKKEEMVNKMYGPDRRLDLVIQQEMPLLQVSFSNFPKSLLCGEVHPIVVYFTNSGSSPLHRLKVACSNPKFFTLSSHGESPKFAGVYHTDNITDGINRTHFTTTLNCKDAGNVNRVVDISIPNGILQPKSTISIPAWIRGDDIGGIHEVDFLFYYEPVQKMSKIRHRLLRHTTIVNTIESLSVRAVAYRASKYDSFACDGKVGACFLSCEMENLSQVQIQKKHVKQIQIVQISCASPHWVLKGVSTSQDSHDVTIGSREILQLCLRGEKQSNLTESVHLKGNTLLFTDIVLSSQISSSKSPCVDFYYRSQTCFKPLEEETVQKSSSNFDVSVKSIEADLSHLNCAIELGMTLIILWQAHIVDERGQDSVSLGQHHVTIDKLDTIFTSYPFVSFTKAFKFEGL